MQIPDPATPLNGTFDPKEAATAFLAGRDFVHEHCRVPNDVLVDFLADMLFWSECTELSSPIELHADRPVTLDELIGHDDFFLNKADELVHEYTSLSEPNDYDGDVSEYLATHSLNDDLLDWLVQCPVPRGFAVEANERLSEQLALVQARQEREEAEHKQWRKERDRQVEEFMDGVTIEVKPLPATLVDDAVKQMKFRKGFVFLSRAESLKEKALHAYVRKNFTNLKELKRKCKQHPASWEINNLLDSRAKDAVQQALLAWCKAEEPCRVPNLKDRLLNRVVAVWRRLAG